ncbi:zinc ribbon domain-containing protein [Companilactobacillus ginsenosidimutans]|uniref:Zinc-ribbon domain-containing protein n=1 Tax=Companilactobacillus ginsenosidimutans TaxID=1007676 RepID=A0A0H4QL99_9LACO|nr:zinc ribbon domain-containing protein [Companilactobacillus ginsenosidimutans]AKP67483.1 hypothetical protein ABM34_08050 [Companilactobacillus ginsenosidimutans]
MSENLFCPNCGTKISSDDVFCPNCGYGLAEFNKQRQQAAAQNTSADNQATNEQQSVQPDPTAQPTEPVQNQQTSSAQNQQAAPVDPAQQQGTQQSAPQNQQPNPQQSQQFNQQPNQQQMQQPVQPQQNQAQNNQAKPSKKPRRKHHRGLVSIIVILIILVGGYFIGSQMFSKSSQLSSLANAMSSGDTSQMSDASVDTNGKTISSSDLEPLSALFQQDSSAKDQIKRIVQNDNGDAKADDVDDSNDSDTNFKVVEVGKYLGMFPKYKVQIKTQPINIDTDVSDPEIKVNNKTVSAAKTDDGYKVEDQLPGVYTVQVSADGKSKSKKITIPLAGNPEFKSMNVNGTKDSDDDDDNDADSNDDSDNSSSSSHSSSSDVDDNDDSDSSSSSASKSDLYGTWTDDDGNEFDCYSDGTYTLGDDSGSWKVTGQTSDTISVYFNNSGGQGGGWSTTFTINGDDSITNSQGATFTK